MNVNTLTFVAHVDLVGTGSGQITVEMGMTLREAKAALRGDFAPITRYAKTYNAHAVITGVKFSQGDEYFIKREIAIQDYADYIEGQ